MKKQKESSSEDEENDEVTPMETSSISRSRNIY